MNRIGKIALGTAAALCLSLAAGCSSSQSPFMGNTREAVLEEGDVFAVISIMDYGDITVKLFPTVAPMAVQRFITLAERQYYDGRNIHRVVKDQLVQGGSITGSGFDGEVALQEYFDVETSNYMRHYYGALCMASNARGNYCQFYIVNNNSKVNIDEIASKVKEDLNDADISAGLLESDKEYYNEYYKKLDEMPDEVKERYAQVGGIYDLDGTDTVFGQVVDGWDVLRALNKVETVAGNITDDRNNIYSKPLDEIVIEKVVVIRITPEETTTTEKTRATRATPAEKPGTASPDDNIVIDDGQGLVTEEATTAESVAAEPVESSFEYETTKPEESDSESGTVEPEESDQESQTAEPEESDPEFPQTVEPEESDQEE